MTALSQLSEIDIITKYIVFGFNRNTEHIPIMVTSLCILYYHIPECMGKCLW